MTRVERAIEALDRKRAVEAALLVLTTTPHIVAYLEAHDPKALSQAQAALTHVYLPEYLTKP